jgi:ribosome-associated heat shock protein Hsp15
MLTAPSSIAGEPDRRARVRVGPPLAASGPRLGSTGALFVRTWSWSTPFWKARQLAPDPIRSWPDARGGVGDRAGARGCRGGLADSERTGHAHAEQQGDRPEPDAPGRGNHDSPLQRADQACTPRRRTLARQAALPRPRSTSAAEGCAARPGTAGAPRATGVRAGRVGSVMDETRIDRWLAAVRLVKTRPLATQLCEGWHVHVNGRDAKASTRIRAGDRVQARIADRDRDVEVVRVIEARVGAPVAATCYIDHSPPPPVETLPPGMEWARGAGRPSKRLRRELDRMRRAPGSS